MTNGPNLFERENQNAVLGVFGDLQKLREVVDCRF